MDSLVSSIYFLTTASTWFLSSSLFHSGSRSLGTRAKPSVTSTAVLARALRGRRQGGSRQGQDTSCQPDPGWQGSLPPSCKEKLRNDLTTGRITGLWHSLGRRTPDPSLACGYFRDQTGRNSPEVGSLFSKWDDDWSDKGPSHFSAGIFTQNSKFRDSENLEATLEP